MPKPWSEYPKQTNRMRYFMMQQVSIYDEAHQRIVFLGGFYENPPKTYLYQKFSSAPIFDMVNGRWSMQNLTGAIPSSRVQHTATVVGSEKKYVLLYGGQKSNDENVWAVSDYCYILDLTSNTWTSQNIVPNYDVALMRTRHSALLVDNNTVFIVYGINDQGAPADSTLILNVTNPLSVLAINSYTHPRAQFAASVPEPTTKNGTDDTSYGNSDPATDDPNDGKIITSDSEQGNTITKEEHEESIHKTIGIAVGCTAGGLVIIGSLVFFFCRRRRSKKHQRELEELEEKRREIETLQKMAHVEEEPMMVNWDEIDKEFGGSPSQPEGSQYTYSPQFSEQTTTIISGSAADNSSPTFPRQEIKNQLLDKIDQYNHNVSTERQASMDQYNNAAPLGRPDVIEEDCHNVQYVPHIQKPDGV
ncbi:hypothetical protein INT47_007545 [Mucor saturninus]|uniref:Uncharacterized protein n=1 Tax=Mucor saturninus TaxID=64648 RepID=A0A8H7V3C2_9FUNG|nr:hypothetical protein INT47_007545 [Mucor saturninus]